MIDEDRALHQDAHLRSLLERYTTSEDRDVWLDRVMHLEGVAAPDLSRLHGQLIALGWIDQNTGAVPRLEANSCPGCYRSTPSGRKALARHLRGIDLEDLAA